MWFLWGSAFLYIRKIKYFNYSQNTIEPRYVFKTYDTYHCCQFVQVVMNDVHKLTSFSKCEILI